MASFIYAYHRKIMEKNGKRLQKFVKEAEMSDQQISEIYRMWLDELNGIDALLNILYLTTKKKVKRGYYH